MYVGWMRGATMYELQIGRIHVTWCFLIGGRWKWWSPKGRFKINIVPKESM